MPSFTVQKTGMKAGEGPQKCTEHQDRVMPLKLRKGELSREKDLVGSIKSCSFSLWFTHSFAKHSELAFLYLGIFQEIGTEDQTQPLPFETSDLVRERDANTSAVPFKASHRDPAKVCPLDLPS